MELNNFRKKIDEIDRSIIILLAKRMKIVKSIGIYKIQNNLPALDKSRWNKVIDSRMKKAKLLGFDPQLIKKIFEIIHEWALKIENKL